MNGARIILYRLHCFLWRENKVVVFFFILTKAFETDISFADLTAYFTIHLDQFCFHL